MVTLSTCASAMEWLLANRADVVILDIALQDGSCELVVQRLTDLAIPFVVFSGSSPKYATLDPIFLKGFWLRKPSSAERIVAAVFDVLSKSRTVA